MLGGDAFLIFIYYFKKKIQIVFIAYDKLE